VIFTHVTREVAHNICGPLPITVGSPCCTRWWRVVSFTLLTTLLLEKQSLVPTEQETGGGPKARLDAVAIDPAKN
jgi:hypothetical protein